MAKAPIIVVAGKAGSGKDTVGAFIKENYNAVSMALADPMKRLARDLFGFTNNQLWGPSECRNVLVEEKDLVIPCGYSYTNIAIPFLEEMGLEERDNDLLFRWFAKMTAQARSEGSISPRIVLQTMGTEWGRTVSPTIWADYAFKNARRVLGGAAGYMKEMGVVEDPLTWAEYVVITDGRFRNEIVGVSYLNGVALHVTGRDKDGPNVGIAGHKSEKELDGIPSHFYDETIVNDQGFEELYDQVADAMAVNYGDSRGHK